MVYKAGFPVMMYEGPYGELSKYDENKNAQSVNKIFTYIDKFIKIIIGDETNPPNLPGVLDKDKWDDIFYQLWSDYNFKSIESGLPPEFELNDIYKKLRKATKGTEEYKNLKQRKKALEKTLNYSYNSLPIEVHKETEYDKIIAKETFGVLCEDESEEETTDFDYIYKPSLGKGNKEEKSKDSKEPKIKTQSADLIKTSKFSDFSKPKDYVIEDLTTLNAVPSLKRLTNEQIEEAKRKEFEEAKVQQGQGGAPQQQRPPQQGQGGVPQQQFRPPQQGQGGAPQQQRPPQQEQQRPPQQQKPPQQGQGGAPQQQGPRRFEQIPPRK
jgi:hypothetical protein